MAPVRFGSVTVWGWNLSAPKSQRFLQFAIAMPIADPRNRSDFLDKRNGGGNGPDHLRVVSPGQRPRDRLTTLPARVFAFLRVRLRVLSFLLSLYYVYYDGVCLLKAGQASGPQPSGYK